MWDGPGPGPRRWRGGPHIRDHREDMYGGRDHPMPDFRDRGGMHMGPMGNMGPRRFEMPPMDMRRLDSPPPMRMHDMDPRDMGGPGGRDFFRHDDEPNFRQVEISYRKTFVNTSFGGPEREPDDMDERNMPPRELGGRFMDTDRDRDDFHGDRPPFPDGRRGFPMDRMDRNDRFREERDRSPLGMRHSEDFDMNLPPYERRMDMDRRGPPFNPRSGFDSDMDFRDRSGPMSDFRGRGRSPPRFENDPLDPVERGRSELPPEDGDNQTTEDPANDDGGDSPLTDFRCGEEMTLAEEWKNRNKEKKSFVNFSKGFGGTIEPTYPMQFGRDDSIRDPLRFSDRDQMTMDYPAKDFNFTCREDFPPMDLPPGRKGPQDFMLPIKERENENKPWLDEREHRQPTPNIDLPHELLKSSETFKDLSHNQAPAQTKMDKDPDLSCSSGPPRDQDYRDIDYRTASRTFDFKPQEFLTPDKLISESKPAAPARFMESASQDQDYRGATLEDPASNTVSISGIPKTASLEQVLAALSTPDGVPLQAMKMKTLVPGYSYDTAIVEFLNLEDAVHIMESNKGSLKIGSSTASMKFIQPEDCNRRPQDLDHHIAHDPMPHLSRPSDPAEGLNGSVPGLAPDTDSREQWLLSSAPPESWQRQINQQQLEEPPREPWSHQQPPLQPQPQPDYNESKTMIIKYLKPETTVTSILKALDPYVYLGERNVRLVKGKTGDKLLCFVDMESHEQLVRLVELFKPEPLYINGFRVTAEIAKPLKNQVRNNPPPAPGTVPGAPPPQPNAMWPPPQLPPPPLQAQQQSFMPPPQYMPPMPPPVSAPTEMQGAFMPAIPDMSMTVNPSVSQGVGYAEIPAQVPVEQVAVMPSQPQIYEGPDVSNYLYDATSGFYYDPETTLYYDPNSRYFYNAETQEYLYWDPVLKTYIPVPSGQSADGHAVAMTVEDQIILSNPAADAPLEMKKQPPNPHSAHIAHTPHVPIVTHTAHTPQTPVTSQPPPAPPAPKTPKTSHTQPTKPTKPSQPHTPSKPVTPIKTQTPQVTPKTPTVTPEPVSAPIGPAPEPSAEPEPAPAPAPATAHSPDKDKDKREDDDKKDKPEDKLKSRAAVKIMKDMERWAKIQNLKKDSSRTPSSLSRDGDDRRQSKSADAGFAVFERKVSGSEELFKMPFAPAKKEESKSKRTMGSLGALVSDYGAGSDDDVEEDKEEQKSSKRSQSSDKEDRLTDWKKMACLLCRRQFPNKDALVRHQQLSDLHKQNMEIHLKIKRSKKELEALENQEKQLNAQAANKSPEKKRKSQSKPQPKQPPPPPPPPQENWASSSREAKSQVSERPGLGAAPAPPQKKKKKPYTHAQYKQAVREAMFARYKELD